MFGRRLVSRRVQPLAAVLVALLFLAACGGDDGDPAATDPPTSEDEALTVAEVLAGEPQGEVAVRGNLFDDGSGLVVCGALAESFPPQCPGQSLPITNPETIDVALASAGEVRWSDQPVTLVGVVDDGGFRVLAPEPESEPEPEREATAPASTADDGAWLTVDGGLVAAIDEQYVP